MYKDQPDPEWQADEYRQARLNFLSICEQAGVAVESHIHTLVSPDGSELATDVALFGPSDATRLLVMVSGVHGVEGFSGSASQVGWIAQEGYRTLPSDTAVLMIHLINPWGAANLRRYTESNVDLCRNFLDFSQPLPVNQSYSAIHDELRLGEKLGDRGQFAGPYLGQMVTESGLEYVVDLFMAGQYEYERGFGYGGSKPEWSNLTLRAILAKYSIGVERTCIIEFHTGLGPWAYGQLITMHQGEELERVRRHFGPCVFNPSADKQPGEEGYRIVTGHTIEAYRESFPGAEISAVTLEFGTYPPDQTLALLVQEHLLMQQPEEVSSKVMQAIRAQLLEYHHPADWEWRCAFWSRSIQVTRQAIAALNS